MGKEHYNNQSDEILCQFVGEGDILAEEILVSRYTRLVRVCARPLFLVGGDSEDLIQEGLLGLLSAIRSFQPNHNASFRTYAETCIRNRLRSAIKAARGGKHSPLNDYISVEAPLFDGSNGQHFPSEESPEDAFIIREELRERFYDLKGRLSGFEFEILPHYLLGLSCSEIAQQVGRTDKSVDNAVQRIRKKMARTPNSGASSES